MKLALRALPAVLLSAVVSAQGSYDDILNTAAASVPASAPVQSRFVSGKRAEVNKGPNGGVVINVDMQSIRTDFNMDPRFEGSSFWPPPAEGTKERGILEGYVSGLVRHENYHVGCCHKGYAGQPATDCQHLAVFIQAAKDTCAAIPAVLEKIAELEAELEELCNNGASQEEKDAKQEEIDEEEGRVKGMCASIEDAKKMTDTEEMKEVAKNCPQPPDPGSSANSCPTPPDPNPDCNVDPVPPPQQPSSPPNHGYPDGLVPACSHCPPGEGGNPPE